MPDIIELLERRDETALVLLKEHYSEYCYAIIYKILRSHEETEEALNDVWLRIWKSIPPARPNRLRAYLARVSRNIALDYLRYKKADKRSASTLPLDEIGEMLPDLAWDQEDQRRQLRDTLNLFLRSLTPEEQRVFLQRYWYNATIEELSRDFGCSQSRITGMLFRMRKRLRGFLEKEGYHYE